MLDALRRGAKTWVAKILLGLLVLSFAIWGVADVVRWGGTPTVAEVGETEITVAEFQRAYDRQLRDLSRQFGQAVDRDFAESIGLPQQVLGRLLSEATLTAAARDAGLGVSDEVLAREIAADPALRPPGSDTFDRGYFARLLRENGLTEEMYIAERRLQSLREQLVDGIVGGMQPPEAYVAVFDRYRTEQRDVRYVVLPLSAAGPAPVPTDSDLEAWYADRKGEFQAPEYRELAVLAVTPEAIADPSSVSAEDVRREYEQGRASFTSPERRRVRQVLFPTSEEAAEASARIKGGASLDDVIAERGLTPADVELGLVAEGDIIDPAIAEVAFSLEPGEVSDPVDARFGSAIVQVVEVEPEVVRPFEEVREEVARSLATRRAEDLVYDTHDEIEDARAGGASLAEIADRFSLPLVTVITDARGQSPEGEVVSGRFPQSGEVLQAAFEAEVGEENDPVRSGLGYVWYEVKDIIPAADRPLAEVRDQVVAAWTAEKTDEALAARAEEMAGALRSGGDIEALAAEIGEAVRTAEDLTRAGQPADFGPEGLEAVFAGPAGHVAAVSGNGRTQVVLQVTDVAVPAFFPEAAESQQVAAQLESQLGDSLLGLYIDRSRDALGSSIDEQALRTATGSTIR